MFESKRDSIAIGAAATLGLAMFLAGAVWAQGPTVNVKSGRFETAGDKNAMKAFRMKEGYKGDAAAKALGDKLFRATKVEDSVTLTDDKANHKIHVTKSDPSGHFRIDRKTGDFSFNKGLKGYVGDGASAALPKKEEAVELAKRHLTELGLMPERPSEMVIRHVGGLKQADVTEDGKTVEHDRLVTVHFGRQIDGIDVGGPGSKIVVDLGSNGDLVGITRRWVELNVDNKTGADFKPQAEVVNGIKAKLQKDAARAKRADASVPDFGYFDDGKGNIEPAYFFTAELTYDLEGIKGGRMEHKEKYHGAVSALRVSKADFEQLQKAKRPPKKATPVAKDKPTVKD